MLEIKNHRALWLMHLGLMLLCGFAIWHKDASWQQVTIFLGAAQVVPGIIGKKTTAPAVTRTPPDQSESGERE